MYGSENSDNSSKIKRASEPSRGWKHYAILDVLRVVIQWLQETE